MKTYSILFAEDVPHYGTADITAASDAEALELAQAYDIGAVCNDPDWSNTACRRIVHIEDAEGNNIAEDVALDGCFLRYGGEPDRRLCDAAPKLLAALNRIAAIPLWCERIADEQLKAELIAAAEYDADKDEFNPSCDTESSYLEQAVDIARAVIAEAKGTSD